MNSTDQNPFLAHINNENVVRRTNKNIIRTKHKDDGFVFFNPIMNVMIVTSCIMAVLCMLIMELNVDTMGTGGEWGTFTFLWAMILQFYILLPAWIAFGRNCKYKEFILFACIFFIIPIALIWSLVGEKNEN